MVAAKRKRSDDGNTELVRALARYIEAHADESLPLEALSRQAHLSPAYLQRTFKAVLGLSPKAFQDAARLRLLKSALKDGKSLLDSMGDAGFQSTSRVYGNSTRSLGMKPSTYRKGGAGESIAFAYRDTSLGPLLMAATDRGVCFAQFGSDSAALLEQLRSEFPKALLEPSQATRSKELDAWIDALESHIAGFAPCPNLPLDLRGTAFQVRIWRFLLSIPDAAVVSYWEVARGVGQPKAVRAAASACAANRIAVLVPCHRVLRGDGGLGGYRWGLDRKRALIEAERHRMAA